MAVVGENDGDPGIEEGELAQPVFQRREVEVGHRERLLRRQKGNFGAALVGRGSADDRERRNRFTVAKLHGMLLAVAPDGELEPARERVDDRHADAVQAAGNLV